LDTTENFEGIPEWYSMAPMLGALFEAELLRALAQRARGEMSRHTFGANGETVFSLWHRVVLGEELPEVIRESGVIG
jgi:hypothetical protein